MKQLFVLRPQLGAAETVTRAEGMGLVAVAMPLFVIEPVEWHAPEAGSFDALLLTSANAVREAGDALALYRSLPVHAVGEATAAAAHDAGLTVASTGIASIERLLDSLSAGLRLLHLCGEHPRMPGRTRQRITSVAVYRSRALVPPDALSTIGGHVVAVHSPRAAARLAELIPEAARSTIRIAAISDAAARAAGDGWERVEVAGQPNDRQLLALAARLCQNPEPQ